MDEPIPKEVFLQSLNRCVADDTFIPKFYDRFLGSSEKVKEHFRFTDFDIQNKMLLRSLELCAGATAGDPESLAEISARAKSHDRYHLNIAPHLYDTWLEAVIETASEFDAQWTEEVEATWRRILGHAIHHMVRQY